MQGVHSLPGVPSETDDAAPERRGTRPGRAASPDDQEGGRVDRISGARHRCMERKKIFRSVWFWVVLVVLLALTFSSFFRGNGGYQEVATSVALEQFADGNASKATITDREPPLDLDLRKDVEGSDKITASYPMGAEDDIFALVSGTNDKSAGAAFDTNATTEKL